MYISAITKEKPPLLEIPEYYREIRNFNTWFKAIKFEEPPSNIMSKCVVASSKRLLGEASKHSMSPYFIIDVDTN